MLSVVACVLLCMLVNSIDTGEGVKLLLSFVVTFFCCGFVCVFIFAEGENCAKMVNFESPKIKLYFKQLVPCIKDGMLFGFIVAFMYAVVTITFPYYYHMWIPEDGSQGSMLGLFFLALVFWTLVICLLSFTWFLPVRSLMHNNFLKCLKKSFIIFFDNPGFTLVVALNNLLLLALSVVFIGLFPGFTGINLANTNALRLRLYKYDWYEVNPGMTKEQRKEVPWDDLLANDKQTLGPRKFRSFIFPWKE